MIYVLTFGLCFFTLINYWNSNRDLFNPSVLFCFSFFASSLFGCIANSIIGIEIENILTVVIFFIGCFIFTVVNYIFKDVIITNKLKFIPIQAPIKWVVLAVFINVISLYFNYRYILDFGALYGAGDFSDSVLIYKMIITFGDLDDVLISPPWYRSLFILMGSAISYISIYYFMFGYFYNYNYKIWLIPMLLYVISSAMDGSRTETFRFITAIMAMGYYAYKNRRGWQSGNGVVLKNVFISLIFIAIIFVSFVFIVGREKTDFSIEYFVWIVFVYVGAPLFNFDYLLSGSVDNNANLFGQMTFYPLINKLGEKLDIHNWIYKLDLPFTSYQNVELGNVYTTYYAFYYDFGFWGCIILTFIMALVLFGVYKYFMSGGVNKIKCLPIMYAYLVNDIVMLPFSNRFYETLTNVGVWYRVIFLYLLILLMNKINSRCEK